MLRATSKGVGAVGVALALGAWHADVDVRSVPAGPAVTVAPKSSSALNCRDRNEGGQIRPDGRRDTMIGPVAFVSLGHQFQAFERSRARSSAWGPDQPIKVVALVRSDTVVKVVVPQDERDYLALLYAPARSRGAHLRYWSVTFRACSQTRDRHSAKVECIWRPYTACESAYTQFPGGLMIDRRAAQGRQRCSELIVKTASKTYRARLFPRQATACG